MTDLTPEENPSEARGTSAPSASELDAIEAIEPTTLLLDRVVILLDPATVRRLVAAARRALELEEAIKGFLDRTEYIALRHPEAEERR